MNDTVIWILLIFVFLIIIGLYISEYTPLDLNEKEKILKLNYLTENFTSESSSTDQEAGASKFFNWGLPDEISDIFEEPKEKKKYNKNKNKCNHTCIDSCPRECPLRCIEEKETPIQICSRCDITLNQDIDKYILKTSVPACPDMNNFVTKNMIPPSLNMSDYILKSEIKPCVETDISKYILKTEIPACPTCPICPECPICPVCPPPVKCKEINEFNIKEHIDLDKYMKKKHVDREYLHKSKVPNLDDYVHKSQFPNMAEYVHKNEVPNLDNYIHKDKVAESDICKKSHPNMNDYIHKDKVAESDICKNSQPNHNMNDYIHKDKVVESDICKNSYPKNKPCPEPKGHIANPLNDPQFLNSMKNSIGEMNESYKKDINLLYKKQEEMDAKLMDPDGFYAGDSLFAKF